MTRGTPARERAQRVAVAVPAHAALADADYADAFRIAAAAEVPAEERTRAAFDEMPAVVRGVVLTAWRHVLGLRLGPPDSPDHILGWTVVENTPSTVVLAASSPLVEARLVVEVDAGHTTVTTLVRYERAVARPVWAAVGVAHRLVAPYLLERAASLDAADATGRPGQ